MGQMRKDVSPVVALLGIVITLTVVQLLYWRGLVGQTGEQMGPRGGRGGGGREAPVQARQSGAVVTTVAGSPEAGHRDGPGGEALFDGPAAVASDWAETVYVADSRNHCVRAISPEGGVRTLAGAPGKPGLVDGPARQARFCGPAGIAVARDGSLLVGDTGNHRIRRIARNGTVSTFAGGGTERDDLGRPVGGHRDGAASEARFHYPVGLAVGDDGAVYVADAANHCVRRIAGDGSVSTLPVAGEGRLETPTHVAVDGEGRIWVADSAGGGLWLGRETGPLSRWEPPEEAARLDAPAGIAVVWEGKSGRRIVASDSGANCLWQIAETEVLLLAGGDKMEPPGWSDGSGDRARFSSPAGLAVGGGSALYVADFGNNCVRKVEFHREMEEVR